MNQDYPSHWEEEKLKELLSFVIGGDWGNSPDTNDNDLVEVLCIRGSEFKNWEKDRGCTSVTRKITESSLGKRQLVEGDILLEISGGGPEQPVGRTVLIDKSVLAFKKDTPKVCTNFLRLLRPATSLNSKFLNLYLKFFYTSGEVVKYQGGSNNLRNLKFKDYSQIEIPIPPTNEQKRIVEKIEELFSELNAGIESLKTAQAKLKIYRQALLKQAFEGKLTEQWRKENGDKLEPAEQLLERIKQEREARYQQQLEDWKAAVKEWESQSKFGKKPSKPKFISDSLIDPIDYPLFEIPKYWKWVQLYQITEKIQIGPFGSLLHKEDYVKNETPLINPTHIKNFQIEPDYSLTVNSKKLQELENYIVDEGDVIVGRRGEMGRCAVIKQRENGWLCGTGSLFVRLLISFNPDFYCRILSSDFTKEYLDNSSIGTTMKNLNQKILYSVPVPIMSKQEQDYIINNLERQTSNIDELEKIIYLQLQKIEALRQSILKKAFSGQLIPQDPNDEPASVLLERIKHAKKYNKTNITKVRSSKRVSQQVSKESMKELIEKKLDSTFDFKQLRESMGGSYETVQELLFEILSEDKSIIKQFFDEEDKTMKFEKVEAE